MIDKLLAPVLEAAGKAVVRGATAVGKAVKEHLVKYGPKYLFGGGAVAAGSGIFAAGKAVGHSEGKMEGTAEQAKRDETKMKQMRENHERERQEWKKIDKEKDELLEEKQAYEDLLDETENKV